MMESKNKVPRDWSYACLQAFFHRNTAIRM